MEKSFENFYIKNKYVVSTAKSNRYHAHKATDIKRILKQLKQE